ncbi:MAG TPA: flagellar motor stator protein MotA [Chthonomonadales bacterium]|nr:flagellar motor stator protein MotA [Chthonomonadales bacterium]
MLVLIGTVIVFGSIVLGFTMAGGELMALVQVAEFVVIGGAGLGALMVATPVPVLKQMTGRLMGLLKGSPYNQATYNELLKMLYDLFMLARREGMVALEHHAEHPYKSDFFRKYPRFAANHHAVEFLSDTLKVIISGSVQPMDLAEMMEIDLDTHHSASSKVPAALAKIGDAMPGFGIVAAVLGVVVTMGAIGGEPELIGRKVAAALVGTFLGVLLAYGFFLPLAAAVEDQVNAEHRYLLCIQGALLAFARGDAPITAVEFARRHVEPNVRCSFAEMEQALKKAGA